MRRFASLVSAIAGIILTTPAAASVSVLQVAEVMRSEGYSGEIIEDGDAILIESDAAAPFEVRLIDCTPAADPVDAYCDEILLLAAFDAADLTDAPDIKALLNEWNASRLFGRAAITDSGEILFDHPIAAAGGLSNTAIAENLAWFDFALEEFLAWIIEAEPAPGV